MRFNRESFTLNQKRKGERERGLLEEEKKRTKEISSFLEKIRSNKTKVSLRELPQWVLNESNNLKKNKIWVLKTETGNKTVFNIEGGFEITVQVKKIRTPQVVIEIERNTERGKEPYFNPLLLEGDSAKKIIEKTGFLEIIESKRGNRTVLKEGTGEWGFLHILYKHFEEFKRDFQIETPGQLREIIAKAVKKAQHVFSAKDRIEYNYLDEKTNKIIRVIADPHSQLIITAYILTEKKNNSNIQYPNSNGQNSNDNWNLEFGN